MTESYILKLLGIEPKDVGRYKVHAAKAVGNVRPLDVYLKDEAEWQSWNTTRSNKNQFNRQYIISFMDFYPLRHSLLFGGIFEVIARFDTHYEIKALDKGRDLIGRLLIEFQTGRNVYWKLESALPKMHLSEIFRLRYEAEPFSGLENICLPFEQFSLIWNKQREDWRKALEHVKGVYLITDLATGKHYVGKADGNYGIWSRWGTYVETGHGGNVELKKLPVEYIRSNFQFTLLEAHIRVDDGYIDKRESFWKEAISSRKNGYNAN